MAKVKFDGHACLGPSFQSICSLLRYSKLGIQPWNVKVMVMAMVKLMATFEAKHSVVTFAFCFMAINPFFSDIANWIFDLKKIMIKVMAKHRPKSNLVIYRSGPPILPKMKEIWKVVWKLSREQKSAAGGTSSGSEIWTGTQTWIHQVHWCHIIVKMV